LRKRPVRKGVVHEKERYEPGPKSQGKQRGGRDMYGGQWHWEVGKGIKMEGPRIKGSKRREGEGQGKRENASAA